VTHVNIEVLENIFPKRGYRTFKYIWVVTKIMSLIEQAGLDLRKMNPNDSRAILFHIVFHYTGAASEICVRCKVPYRFKISGNRKMVEYYNFRHCGREDNKNLQKLNIVAAVEPTCPFYCRAKL
jgi:hypothetical protein